VLCKLLHASLDTTMRATAVTAAGENVALCCGDPWAVVQFSPAAAGGAEGGSGALSLASIACQDSVERLETWWALVEPGAGGKSEWVSQAFLPFPLPFPLPFLPFPQGPWDPWGARQAAKGPVLAAVCPEHGWMEYSH
jgi:hypothetical protein